MADDDSRSDRPSSDRPPNARADEGSRLPVPEMPVHPGRWVHRSLVASGVALVAAAAFKAFPTVDPVGIALLALGGATNVGVGRFGLVLTQGLQLVHAAENQVALGRHEVALELLDRAEKLYGNGAVLAASHALRATIALERGDPEGALAAADRALTVGTSFLSRQPAFRARLSALSLRAFCRAVTGDAKGAREDVAAVDQMLVVHPGFFATTDPAIAALEGVRTLREPLARAKLAEAVLLAQEGDRGALRTLMSEHRTLFAEGTGPRDRALVRGFERLLASPASTAYRRVAAHRAPSDEPLETEDWIERVLPEVAPFVRAAPPSTSDESVASLRTSGQGDLPVAIDWGPAKRIAATVGVWAALVAGIGGAWIASGQLDGRHDPNKALVAVSVAIPLLFLALLVAASVGRIRTLQRRRRALVADLCALARTGDTASERGIAEVARTYDPIIGGQARLALAELANRRGDFAEAAEQASRALVPLGRILMRATASDALIPGLRAQRALAHAALGQTDDANREAEALGDDYSSKARTVYSVKLVSLAHDGELEEAARLTEARPMGALLDRPVDVLSDLVRATHSREGLGLAETQRLEAELRDESMRAWLGKAAPAALAAFEARETHEELRVRIATEETTERTDDDAEAELDAIDETESDPKARLRLG